MQIMEHALEIASPSSSKQEIMNETFLFQKLASPSSSKQQESETSPSPPLDLQPRLHQRQHQHHLEGDYASLDETASLSSPDCRSCSSGTVSLAHPQSPKSNPMIGHLSPMIGHLTSKQQEEQEEAPALSAAGSSPGWRLREAFKAEQSPGSCSRRGIFRRKVLNALNVNELPHALRIAALSAVASPRSPDTKKALDDSISSSTKVNTLPSTLPLFGASSTLTKDESVLARYSQDRKIAVQQQQQQQEQREQEQKAARQRVLEQAAKQQQQFAPHNRPGVAHHGTGTELDDAEPPASCLVDTTITTEGALHANAFLPRAAGSNKDDDDYQSMGSFASTLTPSVVSAVEQQHQTTQLLMQSSRWEMTDDSTSTTMMGEARNHLHSPFRAKTKNAPLAGWQLRELLKTSVHSQKLDTIPDSKPAAPIRHCSTDNHYRQEETKHDDIIVAPKFPDAAAAAAAAAVLAEPDSKPVAPIRQSTRHEEEKCVTPKLPDEGQDFLAFIQTKVQDEKKQQQEQQHLDLPPISPTKRSTLRNVQASKLEAAAVPQPSYMSSPKKWVPPTKKANGGGKGNDLPPGFIAMSESFERLSSSMHSSGAAATKATRSPLPDCKPAVPIRQSTRHEEEKCVALKLPDEGQDFLAFIQTKVQDEKKQQEQQQHLDLPPTPPMKRSSLRNAQASKLDAAAVSQPSYMSSPKQWVPPTKKANGGKGDDLPPGFIAMTESFERLSSSMHSSGAAATKATSSPLPDCKPAVPIRQSTFHEEEKCVTPKLPDEGQDFLAFIQTKVQDEKKQQQEQQHLDLPPTPPMKRSSLRNAQASKLDAAAVSQPSYMSSPKQWVPPTKKANGGGKGNDLPPGFIAMTESFERLSSSMHSSGAAATKVTSSPLPDCKPAVPIRQSTRHEEEKCVTPKLPDEGQDFLAFIQKVVLEETKDQTLVPTPPTKELSVQKEVEKMHSSMPSIGSYSLDEVLVNEKKKWQTSATDPASSSRKRRSPKKSNEKELPPPVFSTMDASFERLSSSMHSFGTVLKDDRNSSTPDSKPAVPIRQSTRHDDDKCVAPKLPDEGQDFLGFLQKVVKQENKPDPPATGPSSMKNRKDLPATFESPHSANRTRSPKVSNKRKVVVKPSTRESPIEKSATNGSSHIRVSMGKLNKRISRQSASDETSVYPSENDDTYSPGSVSRLSTMVSRQSASEPSVERSEKNGSGHIHGSNGKLSKKASKQATSKNETSAELSTENSNHSAIHTRGSKIKFQKKASKRSLKDEPSVDDVANNIDSTNAAGSIIKLKRVSKKALSDAHSLDECANNGSSHITAGSKMKLKKIPKKSSIDEPSLDDSPNNGPSHTAGSKIKLKRVSKKSSKDETVVEKSENSGHCPGSKGKLSKKVSRRSLAEEQFDDEPANKDDRGSKRKLKKRVSKRSLIDEPSLVGSTHNQRRGSKERPVKRNPKESNVTDEPSAAESFTGADSSHRKKKALIKETKAKRTASSLLNPETLAPWQIKEQQMHRVTPVASDSKNSQEEDDDHDDRSRKQAPRSSLSFALGSVGNLRARYRAKNGDNTTRPFFRSFSLSKLKLS
jgi:hypothetical protein